MTSDVVRLPADAVHSTYAGQALQAASSRASIDFVLTMHIVVAVASSVARAERRLRGRRVSLSELFLQVGSMKYHAEVWAGLGVRVFLRVDLNCTNADPFVKCTVDAGIAECATVLT